MGRALPLKHKKKLKKVIKGLKKASKTHAKQAKTLESLKLKKGGAVKDACYHKVKASYIKFFQVLMLLVLLLNVEKRKQVNNGSSKDS